MEYRTPLGTFDTYEEAAEACEKSDLDPNLCVEIVNPDLEDTQLIRNNDVEALIMDNECYWGDYDDYNPRAEEA